MYNVGFGESILLDNNESKCLLVDCGSEKANKDVIFRRIHNDILKYNHKTALITHFHDDHINGFIKMIEKHCHVFDEIIIPNLFFYGINTILQTNRLNLIDLEIIKYLLERKRVKKGRISVLELLSALVKSLSKIRVAERGNTFQLVGSTFEILWPNPNYLLDEKTEEALLRTIPGLDDSINAINEISFDIMQMYRNVIEYNGEENIQNNLSRINNIASRILELPSLEVSEHIIQKWLEKIKRIENNTSIVMQSELYKPSILLTGDIVDSTMKKILEDYYEPHIKTYDHYAIIKAPHHGTDSNHFIKFDVYTKFDYVLISNGETKIHKRGKISKKYNSFFNNYTLCCTNNSNDRCQYRGFFNRCCNNVTCECKNSLVHHDSNWNVIIN